jgi:hypothetical protein
MNRKEELEEKKLKDSEDEEDIMYGAPDDKVWTDKSFAQVESEKRGAVVDNDLVSPLYEALLVCLCCTFLITLRVGSTFTFSRNSLLTVRNSAIKKERG